ncbi:MAG: rRNA maturation RNase YbeY [Chloroflexi bacterium]|nr:rRNA maturation RNase YbeY [Chloroflexota bacterium]
MAYVPSQRIDVQIFPAFANRLSKAWLRKVAGQALDNQGEGKALNVSLVIADDETVHSLNREYRDLDETTDVLAFPLWESRENQEPGADGFVLPAEETIPTGEIVISYPQAARQAREGKKLLRSEIALLIVHGVLHLLGYDHADAQQESHMWARQDEILARVPLR